MKCIFVDAGLATANLACKDSKTCPLAEDMCRPSSLELSRLNFDTALDGQGGGDCMAELCDLDLLSEQGSTIQLSKLGLLDVTRSTNLSGRIDSFTCRSPTTCARLPITAQSQGNTIESDKTDDVDYTSDVRFLSSQVTIYSEYPPSPASSSLLNTESYGSTDKKPAGNSANDRQYNLTSTGQSLLPPIDPEQSRVITRVKRTRFIELEPVQEEDEPNETEISLPRTERRQLQIVVKCITRSKNTICRYKWQILVIAAFILGLGGGMTLYSLTR